MYKSLRSFRDKAVTRDKEITDSQAVAKYIAYINRTNEAGRPLYLFATDCYLFKNEAVHQTCLKLREKQRKRREFHEKHTYYATGFMVFVGSFAVLLGTTGLSA